MRNANTITNKAENSNNATITQHIDTFKKYYPDKTLKELKEMAILLRQKLDTLESERNLMDVEYSQLIDQLKNSELNVEGIVKNWEKLFKENVIEFAEQKGSSDEEVFAAAYHKLVHSPALDTILQVETAYAKTVMDVIKNRDDDIAKLTQQYVPLNE